MTVKKHLIVLILLLTGISVAQSTGLESELARIGDRTITVGEFLERIELTPQFRKQNKKLMPSIKLEFLYTLIAEKLWASHAEKAGFDTTSAIKTAVSSIEKMYVRDELFKREIRDKIVLTDEEIIEGTIRNSIVYSVRYIYSKDSSDVAAQHAKLSSGVPFDTLINNRPEYTEQPQPIDVFFGDLIKNIEDSLYNLDINEYTSPVSAEDGWYIFYAYEKRERVFINKDEIEDAKNTVRKILENRKGEKVQNKFYREFFADKKVDVKKDLFFLLAKELSKVFERKQEIRLKENTTLLTLDPYDVMDIKSAIPDSILMSGFIQFNSFPVSLNDYIDELVFEGLQFEDYTERKLIVRLNTRTKIFIERELLAREGYSRNLDQSEEVRKYVRMWREYYLAQAFLSSQIEKVSISDQQAASYYKSGYDTTYYPEKINIIEILVSDPDTAEYVFKKALEGIDFRILADKYSERMWTKKTSGEYGLFPSSLFGEIGRQASKMNIGEISRPFEVRDGIAIIKLIDRIKEKITPPEKTFDEIKNRLKRELAYDQQLSSLIYTTAEFANKTNISINGYELNNLEVSNLNSFAIRVMGFGGKITAVPLSKPFTEWVYRWLTKPDILP